MQLKEAKPNECSYEVDPSSIEASYNDGLSDTPKLGIYSELQVVKQEDAYVDLKPVNHDIGLTIV